ncbi:MAG: hypothetical protein P8Q94_02810, partial [Candidatus Poseidoniaceae archaeon]|nr:hypothetical protein [Candidatus Poseidoniaceae archaeon]
MSAVTTWRSALFLAILMAIMGPLQMTGNISIKSSDLLSLNNDDYVSFSAIGDEELIQLTGNNAINNDIFLEVPSKSPLTDLQISMSPSVISTQTGFVWGDDTIWSN